MLWIFLIQFFYQQNSLFLVANFLIISCVGVMKLSDVEFMIDDLISFGKSNSFFFIFASIFCISFMLISLLSYIGVKKYIKRLPKKAPYIYFLRSLSFVYIFSFMKISNLKNCFFASSSSYFLSMFNKIPKYFIFLLQEFLESGFF